MNENVQECVVSSQSDFLTVFPVLKFIIRQKLYQKSP